MTPASISLGVLVWTVGADESMQLRRGLEVQLIDPGVPAAHIHEEHEILHSRQKTVVSCSTQLIALSTL